MRICIDVQAELLKLRDDYQKSVERLERWDEKEQMRAAYEEIVGDLNELIVKLKENDYR